MITPNNFVCLTGYIGQDPKVSTCENGTKKILVSMGINKKSKDQQKTNWFNIVAFGKVAELFEMYVKRGSFISILGTLETWTSEKDGIRHTNVNVVADSLSFLPVKKVNDEVNTQQPLNLDNKKEESSQNFYDDDIPF